MGSPDSNPTFSHHFVMDVLFPLLKYSKSGIDDRGHRLRITHTQRRRLIRAIYLLSTAGDMKRYHRLRTVISLVSGFFLMLCAC